VLFMAWRDLANPLAGGSEVLVDRLATGLQARGHEVALLAAEPVQPRPYTVVPNGRKFSQYLRAPFVYASRFRDYDVVVDVANAMAFYATCYRRGPTICFVNHVHTAQWSQWFRPPVAGLGRLLERHAMPFAYRHDVFVAVSDSTACALQRIGVEAGRIRVVENGVDVAVPRTRRSRHPAFVTLGRLVPHKHYEIALAAWRRVHDQVGGTLRIVGTGPERRRLEAVAGPGVEFVGQVSEGDKQRLLGEAWALIHPATIEGWGLVVMEAAAHATPTIGWDAPGLRDSIVDGETGVLVRDVDELARRWVALARRPQALRRLGTAARKRAEHYSWDRSIGRFEGVLLEAAGPRRASRRGTPQAVDA
jgi:glycosyltransferase involved in cell wall biosynthesis